MPSCDVIAVYRDSGVCTETRGGPFQSGNRLGNGCNGRTLPQRRERSMSSAGPTPTGRAQVQAARFRARLNRGQVIIAPNETRGNARQENERMRKSDGDAGNADTDMPSIENTHDLRLTALLFDLVEATGRRGAADVLGVSYGALARAADTGRLSGRMRDALTRHLLGDASDLDEEHQKQLGDLERRVAALEKVAEETPGGEESQVDDGDRTERFDDKFGRLNDEIESLRNRVEGVETRQSPPGPRPAPVAERPTPSRPAYELVVSLHPDPDDDEKRFGAAAPLVAEWRCLREGYGAAPARLAKLRAEEDLLELEMLLIGGCGVTLPPADYPWDRFDLEDQTRRRRRRLAVVQEEIRRAERRCLIRRVFTLGLWRG